MMISERYDGDEMKKLIMTDLDNTLLPMYTQDKFVEIWYTDIAKKFREHGLDPSTALHAMNDGMRAMAFNDGEKTNIDAFYDVTCELSGIDRRAMEVIFDDYYSTTFANIKDITRENPYAPLIAHQIRRRSDIAVVATMPMFPIEACDMRLRWVGLKAEDFDLVTTCDFSRACKPNTKYYSQILDRFGVAPADALMIGNDVREDMEPCESLGIDTFLVTDHIITHGRDYARFRQGGYPELIDYLETL